MKTFRGVLIALTLHPILSWSRNTYLRHLFIDYSSMCNTIVLCKLRTSVVWGYTAPPETEILILTVRVQAVQRSTVTSFLMSTLAVSTIVP